jgi:hypothetical protein
MRMGSSVNGYLFLPAVVRPELDAAALPAADSSHASTVADVPVPTILAPCLTAVAHLVRLAF